MFKLDEDGKFRSVDEAGNFRSAEDEVIRLADGAKCEHLVVDGILRGGQLLKLARMRGRTWRADKNVSVRWTKNTLFSEPSYHH